MTSKSDRVKPNILFLCTGNSCRSHMAEAWMRYLYGDHFNVYSAGLAPKGLDLRMVKVMQESGLDVSAHSSKHLDQLKDVSFSAVITVCGHVNEICPVFPGKTRKIHRGFDDPPQLAISAKTEQDALNYYRRVRDEIRDYIDELPNILESN